MIPVGLNEVPDLVAAAEEGQFVDGAEKGLLVNDIGIDQLQELDLVIIEGIKVDEALALVCGEGGAGEGGSDQLVLSVAKRLVLHPLVEVSEHICGHHILSEHG